MSSKSLVDRLRSNERVCAFWHMSAVPLMVEMSARVGFDTLVIDNEHGPATLSETIGMLRAAQTVGTQSIVRVASHERDVLARTQDTGPDGLLVPMVNTAEDAHRIVDICRYPPLGARGVAASVMKASGYGTNSEYLKQANTQTLLAFQIETETAVDNLDEILTVKGVDMFFIGPGDLCASMGEIGNTSAPNVVARIEEARDKILASGHLMGTVPRPDASAKQLFQQGFNLVIDGSDIGLYRSALEAKLVANRASLT